MVSSWPAALPLFPPYNFLVARWKCVVLSSDKIHEFCFCLRAPISPPPHCVQWCLRVTSFGYWDTLSDDDLLICSSYWRECRRKAAKMIKGQRDGLRGKMRRPRCCYLLVKWSKRTMEAICKHLREWWEQGMWRRKMNGDRKRQEDVLRV